MQQRPFYIAIHLVYNGVDHLQCKHFEKLLKEKELKIKRSQIIKKKIQLVVQEYFVALAVLISSCVSLQADCA